MQHGTVAGSESKYFGGQKLVTPARQIGSGRRSLLDAVQDFGQVHGLVVKPRVGVRQIGIAVPAVFGTRSIGYLGIGGRIRCLQEVIHQVDGVVKEVGVVRAYIEVNLALQFWLQNRPVALQDRV